MNYELDRLDFFSTQLWDDVMTGESFHVLVNRITFLTSKKYLRSAFSIRHVFMIKINIVSSGSEFSKDQFHEYSSFCMDTRYDLMRCTRAFIPFYVVKLRRV